MLAGKSTSAISPHKSGIDSQRRANCESQPINTKRGELAVRYRGPAVAVRRASYDQVDPWSNYVVTGVCMPNGRKIGNVALLRECRHARKGGVVGFLEFNNHFRFVPAKIAPRTTVSLELIRAIVRYFTYRTRKYNAKE